MNRHVKFLYDKYAKTKVDPAGLEPATFSSLVQTYSRYILANNYCKKCTGLFLDSIRQIIAEYATYFDELFSL